MTAEKGVATLAAIGSHLPDATRATARLVLLGGQAAGSQPIGGIDAFRAGFVDEIHAAMAGLDILLHPSSAEGLGTAVIDAMAIGVPPSRSESGDCPSSSRMSARGSWSPPATTGAFAAALDRPRSRLRVPSRTCRSRP
jgi:glycosyltransferase involved in cell wall biosynthesis